MIEVGTSCRTDYADRCLNNSDILRKPNSIILLSSILQEMSALLMKIKTDKNLKSQTYIFYSIILFYIMYIFQFQFHTGKFHRLIQIFNNYGITKCLTIV